MLVVVVVVSTGRPTGITPYPTYGSPFGYILGQAVFGTNVPELFPQGVALHPKQPSYSALTTCPYYRARNGTTVCGSLRTSQTGEAIRSFHFDSIWSKDNLKWLLKLTRQITLSNRHIIMSLSLKITCFRSPYYLDNKSSLQDISKKKNWVSFQVGTMQ